MSFLQRVFFLPLYKNSGCLVQWICTCVLYSISLLHVSVPGPCCIYYYGSVVQCEIRCVDTFYSILSVLNCFDYPWSCMPPYISLLFIFLCEKWHWNFGWGCMESQIAFRRVVVSIRLILHIREPGQFLQL